MPAPCLPYLAYIAYGPTTYRQFGSFVLGACTSRADANRIPRAVSHRAKRLTQIGLRTFLANIPRIPVPMEAIVLLFDQRRNQHRPSPMPGCESRRSPACDAELVCFAPPMRNTTASDQCRAACYCHPQARNSRACWGSINGTYEVDPVCETAGAAS